MPMITIKYVAHRPTATLKRDIAGVVAVLAAEILHKDPKVTAVLVEEAAASNWFAGGRSLADGGHASFWLDIRITDGTNTKDEKAAFVAAAFREMGKLLGPLHEESYVHVHDVRGDAYGFGGLTQERRYIAGKLGAAVAAAA